MLSALFKSTTKSDKDALVDMTAELLRKNRPEYKLWSQLAYSSINSSFLEGFGGSHADAEQMLLLMQQVLQAAKRFDELDPLPSVG